MRRVLPYVIGLCIALWLGGLVTLFIALMSVFAYNRGIGAQVGPVLFGKFEPYQLCLAGIAIAATILWRVYGCSKTRMIMMACLLSSAAIAVISFSWVTPQIIDLWQNRTEDSAARFQQLHMTSRYLYTAMAILVAMAGAALIRSLQVDVDGACSVRPDRPE